MQDLTLTYQYDNGSLPPPHHFEYSVHISTGLAGNLLFQPDYGDEGSCSWVEHFVVTTEQLDSLYRAMLRHKMLRTRWKLQLRPIVGGSHSWLRFAVSGKDYQVPAELVPTQRESVQEVYEMVRNLVPQPVWDQMWLRYDQYKKDHG